MSEISPEDLAQRLDDLLKEVRRQGRAAIAAQAAAESCLEAIREQASAGSPASSDNDDGWATEAADEERVRWLRALIPVCDALDRVIRQAAALDQPRRPVRGWLRRFLPAPEPDDGRAHAALIEGLRVLGAQLEGTLRDLGVSVDRRTGEPVDGERHRVVEVRKPGPGYRRGTVLEVVRPGYALDARIIREAEVVVADAPPTSGK
jgi:molecular chaperone GrpE